MRNIIAGFPKQFTLGLEAAQGISLAGEFDELVICGMGGSALPGKLVAHLIGHGAIKLKKPGTRITLHQDYDLPVQVSPSAAVICVSYSGNTEETLSSLDAALKLKLPSAAITLGARLKERALARNVPLITIPDLDMPPRMGVGLMTAALVRLLENSRLCNEVTDKLAAFSNFNAAKLETHGKSIATKLTGSIPLIYASTPNRVLAEIWKINVNESAKTPAFFNVFPELNHNEMIGCLGGSGSNKKWSLAFVILRDSEDRPRIVQRMNVFTRLAREKGFDIIELDLQGSSRIEKSCSTIVLASWTAYHLALIAGVNPTPVELVEEFKRLLAS